jgi:hypothetical protein
VSDDDDETYKNNKTLRDSSSYSLSRFAVEVELGGNNKNVTKQNKKRTTTRHDTTF